MFEQSKPETLHDTPTHPAHPSLFHSPERKGKNLDRTRPWDLTPKKGYYRGSIKMVAWSAVHLCQKRRCPAYDACKFQKSGRCALMMSYLGAFSEMIHAEFGEEIVKRGERFLYQIGMHLIPLYRILCKLKIAEFGVVSPTFTTDKGVIKPHPIFREIRDTIRAISMMWERLGLNVDSKVIDPSLPDPHNTDRSYADSFGGLPDPRPVKPKLFTPDEEDEEDEEGDYRNEYEDEDYKEKKSE
jgi:hypothetical protein